MLKRSLGSVLAVAALALGGLVTTAPAAEAAPSQGVQLTCRSGDACVYSNAAGTYVYRNPWHTGPISVAAPSGGYVWNHGVRSPELDHIQLFTTWSGSNWTICLHYGPQTAAQPDPTIGYLQPTEVVTSWYWRGECVGNEDYWRRV